VAPAVQVMQNKLSHGESVCATSPQGISSEQILSMFAVCGFSK